MNVGMTSTVELVLVLGWVFCGLVPVLRGRHIPWHIARTHVSQMRPLRPTNSGLLRGNIKDSELEVFLLPDHRMGL